MNISEKEQIEINKYFTKFIISHKDVISFEENSYDIINKIEKEDNTDFLNNWNYLMVLVLIIEKYYGIEKIVTHDNYVGFEFEKYTIQDKGFSKLNAYYVVCFKTLQKLWKENKTSVSYENTEPFDDIDLK